MNNFLKEIKDLFTISLTALALFFIHQFLVLEIFKNEKPPLISIYFFNYSAVLFLLSFFKINLHYKLINPLTSFVILTFIKMLSVVGYFIYFNNYEDFNITILVYNFFPVYFLLLTMEILNLKKSLNNI
jgi:predicted neutral ceramidase superfamily lipid hydrolase